MGKKLVFDWRNKKYDDDPLVITGNTYTDLKKFVDFINEINTVDTVTNVSASVVSPPDSMANTEEVEEVEPESTPKRIRATSRVKHLENKDDNTLS